MRRIISIIMAVLVMCGVVFTACGSGPSVEEQLREKTDEIFGKIQKFDLDFIQTLVDESEKEEGKEDESVAETDSATDEAMMKEVWEYLKDLNKDFKYEITKVDEENLTVAVSCSYPDTKTFAEGLIQKLFAAAFMHLDGSKITDEEMKTIMESSIPKEKDEVVTKEVTLTFEEKDGDYVPTYDSKELVSIASCGFLGYMYQLSDSFGNSDSTDYSAIADQLTYETEEYGTGLIMKVTNPTESDVRVDAQLIFSDDSGKMICENASTVDCLAAGKTVVFGINCYNSDYQSCEYKDVEVQLTTEKSYYSDVTEQLSSEISENDGSVIGKISNDGSESVSQVKACGVFYKDGKAIGYEDGYAWELAPGKFEAVTFNVPYDDRTYDTMEYDDFKLYMTGMGEVQ